MDLTGPEEHDLEMVFDQGCDMVKIDPVEKDIVLCCPMCLDLLLRAAMIYECRSATAFASMRTPRAACSSRDSRRYM